MNEVMLRARPQQQQQKRLERRRGPTLRRRCGNCREKTLGASSRTMLSCFVVTLLIVMALLSRSSVMADVSIILTIEAYEEECFLVHTPAEAHQKPTYLLAGNYELIDNYEARKKKGVAKDIVKLSAEPLMVFVMDAVTDRLLFQSRPKSAHGTFHIPLKRSKKFWICVQNSRSHPLTGEGDDEHPDELTRQVGLSYRVYDAAVEARKKKEESSAAVASNDSKPKTEHDHVAMTWTQKAHSIQDLLRTLQNHQTYMRIREKNHRSITEQTFVDITIWTLAETVTVVLVAVGQIFYFRRFLEQKRPGYM